MADRACRPATTRASGHAASLARVTLHRPLGPSAARATRRGRVGKGGYAGLARLTFGPSASAGIATAAAALALARTEAAKRGRVVVLQALGGGAAGNEYANGWEIAVDDDGDGAVGGAETRVRKSAVALEKIKLGGDATVSFRATGALVGTAAQVFTLCRSSGGTRGYTVTVMPSGTTDVASINTCTP